MDHLWQRPPGTRFPERSVRAAMPGGAKSIPLAGRVMLADAINRSCIDRPDPAPLMRSFPLQRSPAAPRCPRQPAIGRSRFSVTSGPPHRRSFAWMTVLTLALAVFRPAGSVETVVSHIPRPAAVADHASPSCQCFRRRSAICDRVARPDPSERQAPACPRPMALLGLCPSQC
jgi:hypothetical protein